MGKRGTASAAEKLTVKVKKSAKKEPPKSPSMKSVKPVKGKSVPIAATRSVEPRGASKVAASSTRSASIPTSKQYCKDKRFIFSRFQFVTTFEPPIHNMDSFIP